MENKQFVPEDAQEMKFTDGDPRSNAGEQAIKDAGMGDILYAPMHAIQKERAAIWHDPRDEANVPAKSDLSRIESTKHRVFDTGNRK